MFYFSIRPESAVTRGSVYMFAEGRIFFNLRCLAKMAKLHRRPPDMRVVGVIQVNGYLFTRLAHSLPYHWTIPQPAPTSTGIPGTPRIDERRHSAHSTSLRCPEMAAVRLNRSAPHSREISESKRRTACQPGVGSYNSLFCNRSRSGFKRDGSGRH